MHNKTIANNISKQKSPAKPSFFLASIICILAATFYMYEFILQVSPSVMTTELMNDFQLNAASLGAVIAFYYYTYTPMQIPAGLLYDRFGSRCVLSIAILICAAGGFFFSVTNSPIMASTGRAFMGVGSAFSFIGALLLVSRWFPSKYFALLAGFVQMMSSIGAIAGEVPLAKSVLLWGWRDTILWLSVFGVFLALLVLLIVRDAPDDVPHLKKGKIHTKKTENELQRLKQVCGQLQTWWIALYSFLVWAPITGFAALWGIPFLVKAYGITTESASVACAMIWIGIGVGSPLIGWWSDKINRRCLPLNVCAIIGIISLSMIIYDTNINMIFLYFLLFAFGLSASGQSLAFGIVKDNNTACVAGTAMGFNNMGVVAGGALFQPLIGFLLHLYWSGHTENGVPVYLAQNYQKAFIVLPLCYVIAVIISLFFIKETYCKYQWLHKD